MPVLYLLVAIAIVSKITENSYMLSGLYLASLQGIILGIDKEKMNC